MKLKNILLVAFLLLTLIPIIGVSFLLYQSGFNLSKESYTRNLAESINVQEDYISQAIEHNMVADYRFANRVKSLLTDFAADDPAQTKKNALLAAFQTYLETSEDEIAVCVLLDKHNVPMYTIGEQAVLDTVSAQLPNLAELPGQMIQEFSLGKDVYSLGIVTPIFDKQRQYMGSLISIYDKSYMFKIISSYYKVANTSIYIYRKNGGMINYRNPSDEVWNDVVEQALANKDLEKKGILTASYGDIELTGYYKNIQNSPWYIVGVVNHALIYAFTNQFIWVYILIICGVLLADLLLAFYFSRKVVEPIHELIAMMEEYQQNLNSKAGFHFKESGYAETRYLRTKFINLMKTILLVQHNFEGIYQLYHSSDMDDTNIDIDVREQTATCNKEIFQQLMWDVEVPEGACVVERFINCFGEKDRRLLTEVFEKMRDEHLAVKREVEVYTPYFNQKWFHAVVVPMYEDDRLSRIFVQLRDISGFRKQEFASIELARRDPLTGLYNRAGFVECVERTMEAGGGEAELNAVLFIDMNYFKMVNDNFGHKAGDDLLCAISRTMLNTVGHADIVSRFGGDEFAVFLSRTTMEGITQIKEKLNERLVFPFSTEALSFAVSASIGVSTWSCTSSITLANLLQQADDAMYQAKRSFKERENK